MGARELDRALVDARRRTLALFQALAAAGYDQAARVPRLPILNPPLWELGHTAWFAEWFVLRRARTSRPGDALGGSLLAQGDAWFDSNAVAHAARWTLDLPAPAQLVRYGGEVLDRMRERLAREADDDASLYPYRLALAHEDMHGEAMLYTLQTLGAAAPPDMALAPPPQRSGRAAIAFDAADFLPGGDQSQGFVFDNERVPEAQRSGPFTIDAALVRNGDYLAFVDDGGYRCPRYWSEAGQAWLQETGRSAPRYWERAGHGWRSLRFGRSAALEPDEALRHVCLHEAQAYCNWAGRRLPQESEWERAASAGDPAFEWGGLWEWTASRFLPYPGFGADRYLEYSAPWFGTRQVLRGASFATPARLRSPHFRNFFTPERDDIFAGFRTCAP